MLIPFIGCFNTMVVTDFSVHILSNAILSICVVIWVKNSEPWDEVVNSLGVCITESTSRISPITKNISLKISSEDTLILHNNNKLFSLCLKPSTSQPLMGVM